MMMFRKLLRYVFAYDASKQIFNALLPRFVRRKIVSGLDLNTGPFNRSFDDVELIPIQPDGYLAVYFKRNSTGVGPGVSLYVLENEILRFDCLDKGNGHYHSMPCLAAVPGSERSDFAADDREAMVNQTVDEITRNYAAHLAKHFRRRIREFRFDQARLDAAVAEARDKMLTAH